MTEPLFSIITPSFQQGRFIERTIRSVLDQEIESLELLVMDGGSNDETVSILERYGDRLTFRSAPDGGQADAVNQGLARARGEIIGWLNSDDVYYAGALENVARFMADHPEVDVVYGDADHIDTDDRFLEIYPTEPWQPERLLETCFLCQPATFFRRSVVERWGGLDSRLHFCLDYEYWLRLSAAGARFAYLRRRLAGSRLYPDNKTLGHRVTFHAEINRMMRRSQGRTPDRWLINWATEIRRRYVRGSDEDRSHYLGVALLSLLAALYWNRSVSRDHRRLAAEWLAATGRLGPPKAATVRASERRVGALTKPRKRLRIGFDASQTGPRKAGCGWFADSLLGAATKIDKEHTWLVYRTFGDHFWDPSGPPSVERFLRCNVHEGRFHRSFAKMQEFWRRPPADLEAQLGTPDIVHANNFFAPRHLEGTRLVYTLHDLIFLHHPDLTSEANRLACYRGVVGASQHADLILANSHHTRSDFIDTFPLYPADRIAVVYPPNRFAGCDPSAVLPDSLLTVEARLPRRGFWLAVGELEPRKNLVRALEAFAHHRARTTTPRPLVLAGGGGASTPELAAKLAALELTDHVVPLGYVDDATLRWLYANAFAFLFPSLAEGFGMPVVEAMGFGTPVLTSDLEIFREVTHDAALLVDPENPLAIAAGMDHLDREASLQRTFSALGQIRARRFAPRESAAELIARYEEVAGRAKYRGAARQPGDPAPVAGSS